MDYPLRLPDGREVVVPGWGNLPIELVAALSGAKPALHCWAQAADLPYLRDLARQAGLAMREFSREGHASEGRSEVMLGRTPGAVDEAIATWCRPGVNPGPELGYPECCVRRYQDWIEDASRPPDIVRRALGRTPRPARLPFLLNNVFYCYSRVWKEEDAGRRGALDRLNPGLDLNALNVVTWHPCSYRCAASLRKARRTWRTLSRAMPAHAALLRRCLARPVLFWDWDRYAVLQGRSDGRGTVRYSGVQPPFSPLDPRTAGLLREADRVKVAAGGAVELRKGSARLAVLREDPPVLLDFADKE